jgi:hypothetical protein
LLLLLILLFDLAAPYSLPILVHRHIDVDHVGHVHLRNAISELVLGSYDIDLPYRRLVVPRQDHHVGYHHALVHRFLGRTAELGGSIVMVSIDLDNDHDWVDDHALEVVVIDDEPSKLPEAYVRPISVVVWDEGGSGHDSDLGHGFVSSEDVVVRIDVDAVVAGADVAASEPDTSEEPAAIRHEHEASFVVHNPQNQVQDP